MSENEALAKLSALCARTECCVSDMQHKMKNWDLPEGAENRIISFLLKDGFINETRYASAFAKDKFRYYHWGWGKIERGLKLKGISQNDVDVAKKEIEEKDSLSLLRKLLEAKRKTVKGNSEYEIKAKLVRFALSRGFSYDEISEVIQL